MVKKTWLILIPVVVGALLGGAPFVFADATSTITTPAVNEDVNQLNREIKQRKDAIAQLEATIAKYQKSIDQKQTEGVSLKNQISILDLNRQALQANIDVTVNKINQTELEIEALNISITEKESIIARQKAIITKLIQSINADSRRKYLEVLLSFNNFADFYANLTSLEYIYNDLGRSVKAYRLAKEDLDVKLNQVTQRKADLADLKKDLQAKEDVLVAQQTYKQQLLIQTKSKEQEYRALVASLKAQYQQQENEQRTFEDKLRQKLAEEDKLQSGSDISLSWPVPSHYLNALFHDKGYPFRNIFEHTGVDIKAAFGTPVHAAAAGYVAQAKHCSSASCYSYILIVHTTNVSTVYGHMSQLLVEPDQFVSRGDVIGYSGGTPGTVGAGPFVTGAHLHFEVRLNGIPVNPLGYLIR